MKVGNTIYVSGQLSHGEDGTIVGRAGSVEPRIVTGLFDRGDPRL